MHYRKDIDGLRCLAVLPVVFNHAKLPGFSGGFTGVDVFFVISGFLISGIICADLQAGRFLLLDFYERRARRILPALVLVVVASFIAGWLTMLPDPFENFAQSVVATLAFSNNLLLTMTSGYWELESDFKPLLHTWSLGVEEQFYLLYPLLAAAVLRWREKAFPVVMALGIVASFALSWYLTPRTPNAAFYLLHTRAGELLLGGLAAWARPRFTPAPWLANLLSLLGLGLVVGAIVLLDETFAFPSLYSALPSLGAALILLFSQPETLACRLLSLPVFTGVGLISYSAYLWHQPLFAFTRITSVTPPSPALMLGMTALTLVLALLSWRFIEQPFRNRARFTRWQVLGGSALACGVLGVAGLFIYRQDGVPERVPGMGLGHGHYIAYNERVFAYKHDAFTDLAKPHLLVIGNSVGRDLANVMLESGRFAGYEILYRDDLDYCRKDVLAQPHGDLIAKADAVAIASNWYYDPNCKLIPTNAAPLSQKPVVLVGPKHFGFNLNAYIDVRPDQRPQLRATLIPDTIRSDAQYRALVPAPLYVDQLAIMQRRFHGVPVFDEKGAILSADRVHLTQAGARFFATFLLDDSAFAPLLAVGQQRR